MKILAGFALLTMLAATVTNSIEFFWKIAYPLKYKEEIVTYSREHRLDPYLVAAVIHVESRFRPEAESSKGALGLMQVLPDTGNWVAVQLGLPEYEPASLLDPAQNIRFGTWYLSDLFREFNGDPATVLAAYNAGRGRVRQWLNSEQWVGTKHSIEDIPFRETRDFARRVLSAYERYRSLYPGELSPLKSSAPKPSPLKIPAQTRTLHRLN